MKLYRNAIILIVILALLGGAYAFLKYKDAGKGGKTETDNSIKIMELDSEKITDLSIENKNGKFSFTRKTVKENDTEKKVWAYADNQNADFEQSKVESVVSSMTYVSAERVIEENASDLSQYGLTNPSVISIKLSDGTEKVLEFGDKTPTADSYYMKEKGSSKVYTVGSYKGDYVVDFGKGDIMVKTLFPEKAEDITSLTLERNGALVFTAIKKSESEWDLTAPIEAKASMDKISAALTKIVAASKNEFIEENAADLDKYGLKNPLYSLEVGTSSGKTRIFIGKEKTKGEYVYVKTADSNDVFTMSESSFTFIDMPLKEAVESFVFIPNINDVNKVVVEMDGHTTTSEIVTNKDDKDKDKFTVNGKDASMKDSSDKQPFRNYYQALIGVMLYDVEIGAKPVGNPEITFTYYMKTSPEVVKIEFIPKDENYYYAVKNGVYTNFIVAKSKFDEADGVRDTYKKLMEAINKK